MSKVLVNHVTDRHRERQLAFAEVPCENSHVVLSAGFSGTFQFLPNGTWKFAKGYYDPVLPIPEEGTHPWRMSQWELPNQWRWSFSPDAEAAMSTFVEGLFHAALVSAYTIPPGEGEQSMLIEYIDTEKCDDVRTENYRRLSAEGCIINNAYSKEAHSIKTAVSYLEDSVTPELTEHLGHLGVVSHGQYESKIRLNATITGLRSVSAIGITTNDAVALMGQTSSLIDAESLGTLALAKMHKNYMGADMDALVTAAELPKTLSYIRDKLLLLRNILRSISTGGWKKHAPKAWRKFKRLSLKDKNLKLLDFWGEIWLEMRFAIRPLLMDIEGAEKLLTKSFEAPPRQTFRGFTAEADGDRVSLPLVLNGTEALFVGGFSQSVEVRAGCICDVKSSSTLATDLGLFNIAYTAWELVPYSFVVDKFINIMTLVNSLTYNPVLKPLTSWICSDDLSILDGRIEFPNDEAIDSIPFRYSRNIRSRTPDPETQLINLDIDIDIPDLLDLAALLRGIGRNSPNLRL